MEKYSSGALFSKRRLKLRKRGDILTAVFASGRGGGLNPCSSFFKERVAHLNRLYFARKEVTLNEVRDARERG